MCGRYGWSDVAPNPFAKQRPNLLIIVNKGNPDLFFSNVHLFQPSLSFLKLMKNEFGATIFILFDMMSLPRHHLDHRRCRPLLLISLNQCCWSVRRHRPERHP
jgi:hypothetical protein